MLFGGLQFQSEQRSLRLCEVYIPPSINSATIRAFVDHGTALSKNRFSIYKFTNNNVYRCLFSNKDGENVASYSINSLEPGFHKFSANINNISANIYVNGVKGEYSSPTSKWFPTEYGTVAIGTLNTGAYPANTIIRNIIISRAKRADADVTARAGFTGDIGFPADEDCTLIMPLKHDLSAYRVVER